MSIVSWILFGIIVGIIANTLDDQRRGDKLVMTIFLGISGALLGGILASLVWGGEMSRFHLTSFIVSMTGALGILLLGKLTRKV